MRYQAPIQFMSIKKYHHNNLFKFSILCLYICVDVCFDTAHLYKRILKQRGKQCKPAYDIHSYWNHVHHQWAWVEKSRLA